MKRKGNLIHLICDIRNIYLADKNARKTKKKSKVFIEEHDKNLVEENERLASDLLNGRYKTSKYFKFKIYEPKEREIYRLPYYPDRIAQHAILNILRNCWNKYFIKSTYSCIKGRGIHRCLKDLKKVLIKTLNTDKTKYCLKLDITKFYPSIDHQILKDIILRKIKDKRVLNILYEVIDSVNGFYDKKGKSVPIGNYLSQYFANLYLTPFDHMIKEDLKCRYYFRYADDIVILSDSKDNLRNILFKIKEYLNKELKLNIKDNYQIFPVESRGIDFVGYVFRHKYIKLRKGIKLRLKKKINTNSFYKLKKILPSYFGWMKHCNAMHLKNTIVKTINNKYNGL